MSKLKGMFEVEVDVIDTMSMVIEPCMFMEGYWLNINQHANLTFSTLEGLEYFADQLNMLVLAIKNEEESLRED